ncbi:hypothetical protein POPTR_011G035913v4 [Populus trichocarpa]|uniref:Uncharacterized protein n=1 Tax=Populus trichocarpa TaxID=3694 RepID=A0ACC0S8N4_POPTR|nr:hypothetical protein POPTR_011G035913v4 [Populus trichocarpa]
MIGSFLLATHTTVCSGILWYQIPRYLLLELPGQKNPSAKLFPLEIRRSPSLTVWFVFKESWDVQDDNWSDCRRIQKQHKKDNKHKERWNCVEKDKIIQTFILKNFLIKFKY